MLNIHTLLGKKDLHISIACLESLRRCSAEDFQLVIHEDGSLKSRDIEMLRSGLGEFQLITRIEADQRIADELKDLPACLEWRRNNVLALKLLDLSVYSEKMINFVDSDILFLRPFAGLYSEVQHRPFSVFMDNTEDSYSLRPWNVPPLGSIRIRSQINSGIISFPKSQFSFGLLEKFLSNPALVRAFTIRPKWAEQTLWAILASGFDCRLIDPLRVVMATKKMGLVADDTVAIHFVSSWRGAIGGFLERAKSADRSAPAVQLCSIPSKAASAWTCARSDYRRYRSRKSKTSSPA